MSTTTFSWSLGPCQNKSLKVLAESFVPTFASDQNLSPFSGVIMPASGSPLSLHRTLPNINFSTKINTPLCPIETYVEFHAPNISEKSLNNVRNVEKLAQPTYHHHLTSEQFSDLYRTLYIFPPFTTRPAPSKM
jgi:hypothetical protein